MSPDTQWPRFQVFVQDKPEAPYLDYGSVHAPDAEMALMNARDVFARRPACVSMWVVPVENIFSKTAEELEDWEPENKTLHPGSGETYQVFRKTRHIGTQTFIGQVEAGSPEQALKNALARFGPADTALVWWVFPERKVLESKIDDIPSMYMPASEKKFRLSTDFKTLTAMREIRKKPEDE